MVKPLKSSANVLPKKLIDGQTGKRKDGKCFPTNRTPTAQEIERLFRKIYIGKEGPKFHDEMPVIEPFPMPTILDGWHISEMRVGILIGIAWQKEQSK